MDKELVPTTEDSRLKPLAGDNPIKDKEHDALERAGIVENFVQQVLELDATEGAAVGIFGQWGSGKTSFVNLACKEFEDSGVPVLKFNPWLFNGAEELVWRFFGELSSSMGMQDRLKGIGEAFGKYGSALNSLVTAATAILGFPQIENLIKALTDSADRFQPESIGSLQNKVEDSLVSVRWSRDRRFICPVITWNT